MFLERCCFTWLFWVSSRDRRDHSQMGSVLLEGEYDYAMPENSALLVHKLIKSPPVCTTWVRSVAELLQKKVM